MKILIYNWKDIKHPGAGGAEVLTYEVAKRWIKKGHEVTWFSPAFEGCEKEEEIDGINIVRDGDKFSVYKKAKDYYINRFSKEGFDVVIDETNTRPFFAKDFVKDAKVVFFIHQLAREWWFYETKFPMNFAGYFIENFWLKRYANYPTVTVSESTKQDLVQLGFKNVKIISEGISFKPFNRIPEKNMKPTICFLGRLNKGKRVELALKAFEIVKEEIEDAEFWVIGDGYMKEKLAKRFKNARFFGKVSESEKIKLLSLSWLQVNPSVREGWGINVIEGNACGTPCIAFDVPGLRDSIKHNQTGILVKEDGNIQKLAEAIMMVLKDKKLRQKLSKNALEYSKQFSWDKSADEFLDIIESL
ncbi:MAG: glycosyltransferase family 4 protein [Candidatus Aenigmarchaeota archaeon]|nr:glycosyltransferase family 4 protein [Candidatus Aenigmarchaeota archaeon]